jgi:hypothetical protein
MVQYMRYRQAYQRRLYRERTPIVFVAHAANHGSQVAKLAGVGQEVISLAGARQGLAVICGAPLQPVRTGSEDVGKRPQEEAKRDRGRLLALLGDWVLVFACHRVPLDPASRMLANRTGTLRHPLACRQVDPLGNQVGGLVGVRQLGIARAAKV